MSFENILRQFQNNAEKLAEQPCLQFKKDKRWQTLNWLETLDKIKLHSESLKKLGIQTQDRVSILSNTRLEWTLFDMAILSLGAVTVPIYQSNRAEEVEHILNDSGARVVIVENESQLKKVLKVWKQLPHLEKTILIEGQSSNDKVLNYDQFQKLAEGLSSDFDTRIRQIAAKDLASLVYTSGTTGAPKGVMITHEGILSQNEALSRIVPLTADSVGLCFLPLAHILARVIQYFQLGFGFCHAYAESIDRLVDNIREVRPHLMVSVPRIFEKIYQNMMHQVENSSATRQNIFAWARDVGSQYSKKLQAKASLPLGLRLKYKIAHRLVFSKLHKKLGGRIQFFVSGGAPLSQEIAEFFHGAGLLILEGYGLTETTCAINANAFHDYSFGTVGKPLHGVEEKIADDGEILVRGPMVMFGYWKRPDATQEVIDQEGWFHTGDIGEFDDKGFLKITDRKKDIIVTAGGKNIAPQNIENVLKNEPLISQVMVHGDRRKFLSALVTLNPDQLKIKAKGLGLNGGQPEELAKHPKIFNEIKKIIENKNKNFAKYETIKKFAIIEKDFTIEGGELTPTLKIKRKVISQRYKEILDKLYNE